MQSTNVKPLPGLLTKYNLFYEQDKLIRDQIEGNARWVATLSNGLQIYQDDFRVYDQYKDERQYSTWVRLRSYCLAEGHYLVGLRIQFRSNVQFLPENAEGYYLCKSILGSFGETKNSHFFIAGTVEKGILQVVRYKLPELIDIETEYRELKKNDLCLITREDAENAVRSS